MTNATRLAARIALSAFLASGVMWAASVYWWLGLIVFIFVDAFIHD